MNEPLEQLCINTVRVLAADAVEKANSGHPGMPMGAAPMGHLLWSKYLRYNPANPDWINRDRFILSAGHGCLLQYCYLYLTGYPLTLQDLEQFRQLSPVQIKPFPFLVLTQDFLVPEKPLSEDCLYLNVWTNRQERHSKKPVVVWIYGGGFNTGGAAAPAYDGEQMAVKGCVFVSFNYRLGIFGFFAHPDLSKESEMHTSGNYGLLDQIAVLHWIRANIASFGGDPDNVTIAGQSAGSMSVYCLLASPLARGYVQRAIAESGVFVPNSGFFHVPDLHSAEKNGQAITKEMKAGSLNELRKIPAERLFYAALRFYGPIVDGYVLPNSVLKGPVSSNPSHVPLLAGWNQDEGIVMTFRKKEQFAQQLSNEFGTRSGRMLAYYPAATDSQAAMSQLALSRDKMIAAPQYQLANTWSQAGDSVYLYVFARQLPPIDQMNRYGAFHTAEIPYVLHNLGIVHRSWTALDFKLEDQLSTYWMNFARSGNPNGDKLPHWPLYSHADKTLMLFGDSIEEARVPNDQALDFLLANQSNGSSF